MAQNAAETDEKTRYEAAKKELAQALKKKRDLDKQLSSIETQIHNTETSYLSDTYTQGGGNIIQGFDNYLKNQNVTRRRPEVTDNDRLFSTSSATYQKSLDLQGDAEDSPVIQEESVKSAVGPPTISLPAAKGSEISAAQAQKKQRDRDYQRKKRASSTRRQSTAGVESDDESVAASTTSSRRPNKRSRVADEE